MSDTPPKTVAVIYNPISGGSRGESISLRVEERLIAGGFRVERHATRDRLGAAPMAKELADRADDGLDLVRVIVAGGDGSVREAINGLGPTAERIPLGIVPTGNANIVARELGISKNIDEAIETATSGTPVPLDVGTVTTDTATELFVAVVGIGWDAHTVRMMDRVRHSNGGRFAYRMWADGLYGVTGLAAALRPGQVRFSVSVDDQPLSGDFCAAWISNLRTYGKGMSVTPEAHRASGRLHVQARRRSAPPFLASQLAHALRGTHTPASIAEYAEGTRVRLLASEPFAIQIDGDDRGWTRTLDVGLRPGAARVVAPSTV